MLKVPLTEINEALLHQVCIEQWPESQTLEFKATMPGNDEAKRDEFRKDVTAMANADGGDLIFGISTRADRANAVFGHSEVPDAAQRRLQQILDSRVEPVIRGIQYFNCPAEDGKHVLVMRIPSSFHGPHRIGSAAAHRFVFRDNTKASDMSYDHLRNAFGQATVLRKKAEDLHGERVQRILRKLTPRVLEAGSMAVVHIIPINGLAGRVSLDIPGVIKASKLFELNEHDNWTRRPNFDGMVSCPPAIDMSSDQYVQVFRDGAFEAVRVVRYDLPNGNETALVASWTGDLLRDSISAYAGAAAKLGIYGGAAVFLSALETRGKILALTRDYSFSRNRQQDDAINLKPAWIEDINATLDLNAITRPILDVLYQAFGIEHCQLFRPDGSWIAG